MNDACDKTDCLWFGRCVVERPVTDTNLCYVVRDRVQPQPALKKLMTIRSIDKSGNKQEALCETRAQVVLYLNAMPEPVGFVNILFHESGNLLTATRSTFVKAARNGELWHQGSER